MTNYLWMLPFLVCMLNQPSISFLFSVDLGKHHSDRSSIHSGDFDWNYAVMTSLSKQVVTSSLPWLVTPYCQCCRSPRKSNFWGILSTSDPTMNVSLQNPIRKKCSQRRYKKSIYIFTKISHPEKNAAILFKNLSKLVLVF